MTADRTHTWVVSARTAAAHAITDRLTHGATTYTVCGRRLTTERVTAAGATSKRCKACERFIADGTGWA